MPQGYVRTLFLEVWGPSGEVRTFLDRFLPYSCSYSSPARCPNLTLKPCVQFSPRSNINSLVVRVYAAHLGFLTVSLSLRRFSGETAFHHIVH